MVCNECELLPDTTILLCPLHAAAPKLLAACKAAYERFQQAGIEDSVLRDAIHAAEPESPMQSGG